MRDDSGPYHQSRGFPRQGSRIDRIHPHRVESQQSICDSNGFGSTASGKPNSKSQCHTCLYPIPSQQTTQLLPLLTAIVDCFFLALPWLSTSCAYHRSCPVRNTERQNETLSSSLQSLHTKRQRLDCHHSKTASQVLPD